MRDDPQRALGRRVGRREVLVSGIGAGVGVAVGAAAAASLTAGRAEGPAPLTDGVTGGSTIPFHGAHQAGIETAPQAHATFVALDLHETTGRDALRRMLTVLTDDAAALTAGQGALADSEPELAVRPARLTVTVGFGPRLVARTGSSVPAWLAPLPAFGIDRLEDAWSDGDLLLHIGSDDPVTVAHAARMLLKDARSFATVRWRQAGFRRARDSDPAGTTMRNLLGQVDGTVNPLPGTPDFDDVVWAPRSNPSWLRGGTGLVLRRIAMDLDAWDRLDRPGREVAVGRRLSNGAPLTGRRESDEPDFTATATTGFPVIPAFAHIRRARSEDPSERIHRRGYNYDDPPLSSGVSNSGLIFASYQADVSAQYVPLQRRLDQLDLLNQWTTPIGSAVFAIPPGCAPRGFLGETLF